MSDYVRKKAIRYKLKPEEQAKFQEEAEKVEEWLPEFLEEHYGIPDSYLKKKGFAIDSGYKLDGGTQIYIDYVLSFTYGEESGDFAFVTKLPEDEEAKAIAIFKRNFTDLNIDEVRYVDYCYYNGVDAPQVYDEITFENIDIASLLKEE